MKVQKPQNLSQTARKVQEITDMNAEVERTEKALLPQSILTRDEAAKALQSLGLSFPDIAVERNIGFISPRVGKINSSMGEEVVVIGMMDKTKGAVVANIVIDKKTGQSEVRKLQ